jgi:hypothetical protein
MTEAFGMTETSWVAISAGTSVLVAIGTAILAWFTYGLAKETRRSLELAKNALDEERQEHQAEERRHMDTFMPHIALMVKYEKLELQGPGLAQLFVSLYMRNIGPGLAHNISVSHSNISNGTQFFVYDAPTALGAKDDFLLAAKDAANQLTFMGYTVTYQDVFSRKFESQIPNDIKIYSRYTSQRVSPD